MADVVILNADNDTVKTPFNDLESLPSDVVSIYTFSTTAVLSVLNQLKLFLELVLRYHNFF